jgi:3-phenylpropionate/trans-cinnamate dioxygenase ferredoxin reductase subunit
MVIVGGGQAGAWVARSLRKQGFGGAITIVAEENHPPYERPPLSKAVLAGQVLPESTYLFQPDGLQKFGVNVVQGTRALAVHRSEKRVELEGAADLPYEKLFLCTGGRARSLATPGIDLPGVCRLRTIDDALSIAPALTAGSRIVVIGGGWIGLEVAATARSKGADVTVVEAQSRVCERTVPADVSMYLTAAHEERGVVLLFNRKVAQISRTRQTQLAVQLTDGDELTADLVVVGAGLLANDELARGSGLACDEGILVDQACRTSDANIYAAGDVTVAPNGWVGKAIRLESWRNAQDQAIAAAEAALGLPTSYDPLPFFWSHQYDIYLQLYGLAKPLHRAVVRGDPNGKTFMVFYLEDDRVKAIAASNTARDARIARQLIEQNIEVRDSELADPSVSLASLARSTGGQQAAGEKKSSARGLA